MLVYLVLVLFADCTRDFYGAFATLEDACEARKDCREMQPYTHQNARSVGHCVVFTATLGRHYLGFNLPCPVDEEDVGFADEQPVVRKIL